VTDCLSAGLLPPVDNTGMWVCGQPDRRVARNIGLLAEQEETEENRDKEMSRLVEIRRSWGVREAEASVMEPPDMSTLAGSYRGTPCGLELTVVSSGETSGIFPLGGK
jgi:hypothetical protein